MKKYNVTQLELFPDISAADNNGQGNTSVRSLKKYAGYEKIILLSISYIIVIILAFSMGIEKGKKIASISNIDRKENSEQQITIVKTKQPTKALENKAIGASRPLKERQTTVETKKEIKKLPQAEIKQEPTINYTIQVATYISSNHANREIERLKKNGFPTYSINTGKHVLVCVGNFANREEAKQPLQKLKDKYSDCFIRKL